MPITQAGKTIIFEQYNVSTKFTDNQPPDRLDFMLSDAPRESDINRIEERLGVGSFQEFLEKFKPVIYEQQLVTPDGEPMFNYTIEEPEGAYNIIDITSEKFYQMAMKLYEQKNASGFDNETFDYASIQEVLTPKSALSDARKIRKELEYHIREYTLLKDKLPEAARKHAAHCRRLRSEIVKKFYTSSPLALLPLAMDDVQRKINFVDDSVKQLGDSSSSSNSSPKMLACSISFDEDGDIKIDPAPQKSPDEDMKQLTTSESQLLQIVENDYDRYSSESMRSSGFGKKLMISTFCTTKALQVMPPREELAERRDKYANLYKKVQESFARQMIALVEKFLNVKAFFDHASENGIVSPKVIIANCTIADLMEDGKRENFVAYIKKMGRENNDKKIWYAVVPALRHFLFADNENDDVEIDPFGDLDLGDTLDDVVPELSNTVTFDTFKTFVRLMEGAKIMTFFNFKANDRTSFNELDAEIVRNYKSECERIDSSAKDFCVLCYPNFTLLPKSKKRNPLCKITAEKVVDGVVQMGEEDMYIDSPSIYLDSSYIACGMMIAAHDLKILRKKGFPVLEDAESPAVRFDFEGSFTVNKTAVPCWKIMTTKMNRESASSSMEKELEDEIKQSGGFGFCFSSLETRLGDGVLRNAYVYRARTLKAENYETADGVMKTQYRPIYKPLVNTFLWMYNALLQDGKAFKKQTNRWGQEDHKRYINNPIYNVDGLNNEKITIDENKKVTVVYGKSWDDTGIVVEDIVSAS